MNKEQLKQSIDTSIPVLAPAKSNPPSPSPCGKTTCIIPSWWIRASTQRRRNPRPLEFEAAGPRRHLYFDPLRTKAAVVTCGGLCPGLNDVIRAIVMEAYHHYHMAGVLGIPFGLEGFIPKYGHRYIELTPDKVRDIHLFGGTVLGSSRGRRIPARSSTPWSAATSTCSSSSAATAP